MDNAYNDVKNYIHNELGITKKEIRGIIQKTVEDEVKKLIRDESFVESFVREQLKDVLAGEYDNPIYKHMFSLNSIVYDGVCNEISKVVKENIRIKVEMNPGNLDVVEMLSKNE